MSVPTDPAGQAPGTGSETESETTTQDTTPEPDHKGTPTWEMVEELRQENARRRVASKEIDDAFSGYQPEEKAALLDIAKQLADPALQPAAAKRLQSIAERILSDSDTGVKRPTGEVDPDERPLTRREWKELEAKRDSDEKAKLSMDAIYKEAAKLGYEDPNSEESALLFRYALNETEGDLSKADERVKAYKQAIVDNYAKEVEAQRDKWLSSPGAAGGFGAGTGKQPSTFSEAAAAFREMLKAR